MEEEDRVFFPETDNLTDEIDQSQVAIPTSMYTDNLKVGGDRSHSPVFAINSRIFLRQMTHSTFEISS